jgi:2-polyprenyl-3-methyl-5-hydroxy-6-metoxy-1,4-benzoquinol methylase
MTALAVSRQDIAPPEEFLHPPRPWIAAEEVPACPICRATNFQEYAAGYDYELLTCANRWRFVKCAACGHVWLNPRPAIAALGVIYPPTYYAYNYERINPIARRAKELLDGRKMAGILRHCPAQPRSYLDIGCGDGRFLRLMERRGMPRESLYGLELDRNVVQGLRCRGYTGVFCDRAEDARSLPESAIDLVTMFHVIEHVDNPGAVIGRILGWLSPGGVLALETPNLDSLDARIFRRTYWGGYHIPRHWNLFTPATLRRLLEANGLEVVSTVFQTGHSFWMYSLHHGVRFGRGSRPRAGAFFDPTRGLLGVAAFTAFDLIRGRLGWKTSAMLAICRKPAHLGGPPT